MMFIYLIRHGQAQGGVDDHGGLYYTEADPPLTGRGVEQARRAGGRLQAAAIGRIYSSDLQRTRQTAAAINEALQVPLVVRPELREIAKGRWEGITEAEQRESDPEFYARWSRHEEDLAYPGGESGADVVRRCGPVLEEILGSGLPAAALVTHSGTIRILFCHFLGIGHEKRFYLGMPTEYCSLSAVEYLEAERRFRVLSINDTGHLEGI